MSTTAEEIVASISDATQVGFRDNLVARGRARSIIWKNGVLPDGAPPFSSQLSYDLESYGYALLELGLRLLHLEGDPAKARNAFEKAASAIEAVIAKGATEEDDRSFHFVMAATSYHLAHLSARAFSLLKIVEGDSNYSPIEHSLVYLMLRNIPDLRTSVLDYRASNSGNDKRIVAVIQSGIEQQGQVIDTIEEYDDFLVEGVNIALTDAFFAAMSLFLAALEFGEQRFLDQAQEKLSTSLAVCGELNLLPQWWSHRIAIHLLSDLWNNTFHMRIPPHLKDDSEAIDWSNHRRIFIALLYRRERSEIDLWPSQFEAAARAVDQSDDLVVSLPTSAGKTRIAELCILRCLAEGRRVVFMTPLRALSAQTETTLQKTFGPLGKTVSALYGSIGANGFDEDAIRRRDIVVATPEKLDFALRNDSSLLDDVGLLVFDEGHMIGRDEREVRYEVQIQRMLRRSDASQRRIVCLSAVLPEGDQLEDFSSWLCRDDSREPIKNDWRPTLLRFGEVEWTSESATLYLRVDGEIPWVHRYLKKLDPPNDVRRTNSYPNDQRELCIATAWRLNEDGQSVLIYCPERRSVEPFAKSIVDLHRQGILPSLFDAAPSVLATAIAMGEEWLGRDSAVLKCLRLGVGLHHAALPTAYRKEVEHLLREKILKVMISSPTLAQGLNLSATAIIMHSIHRNREVIKISEFKNVIGRAGRAYVDVEGIVLFPMFGRVKEDKGKWEALITNLGAREMESGLVQLIRELLVRMNTRVKGDINQLMEYVVNNSVAWVFPESAGESQRKREIALGRWEQNIATLDTAILGLIGESDIPDEDIASALDIVLQSSLWNRCLQRLGDEWQGVLRASLLARSQLIWSQSTASQRRGYFLAGIGLESGHKLDAIAPTVNPLLVRANTGILVDDADMAIDSIIDLATHVFTFFPFKPKYVLENWQEVLRCWLLGKSPASLATRNQSKALQFIEQDVVYRLSWAMESIRVRAIANKDNVGVPDMTFEDLELTLAVSAIETGTLRRAASTLIQAGFSSRTAAIKVVIDTDARFESGSGLQPWLDSEIVVAKSAQPDWPTVETKRMWTEFVKNFGVKKNHVWTDQRYFTSVAWLGQPLSPSTPVHVHQGAEQLHILSTDGAPRGTINRILNPSRKGLLRSRVGQHTNQIELLYLGPRDLFETSTPRENEIR